MVGALIASGLASFALGLLGLGAICWASLLLLIPALVRLWPSVVAWARRLASPSEEWASAYYTVLAAACGTFLLYGITEGDSVMYHVPLAWHHLSRLVAPVDNTVAYFPHLYESLAAPLLGLVGDRAFIIINAACIVWLGTMSPLAAFIGLLYSLMGSAKPDIFAAAMVVAAWRSRGWLAIGLACAAVYASKMTALPFILPVLWREPRALIPMAVACLPWALHSMWWLGNPVFPAMTKFFITAGWSREAAAAFGLHGNWFANPTAFPRALLWACPAAALAILSPERVRLLWTVGLGFLLLPPEGRYLLPLAALLCAYPPRALDPVGRGNWWFLAVGGFCVLALEGINRENNPLDLLGGARAAVRGKILTVGEPRKWPHLRYDTCQGLNDPPVIRDAVRASFTEGDIWKRLVVQGRYRHILHNKSICANWAREMAKFRWTDREVLLWSRFVKGYMFVEAHGGEKDTRTGNVVLLGFGPGKVKPPPREIPGLAGEVWLLGVGRR